MTDDRGRITVFLFFQKKKTTVIGHRSSAIDVSCRDRMRQTGNTYPKPPDARTATHGHRLPGWLWWLLHRRRKKTCFQRISLGSRILNVDSIFFQRWIRLLWVCVSVFLPGLLHRRWPECWVDLIYHLQTAWPDYILFFFSICIKR